MAVYTEVDDDEMASFVASYGLGTLLSCKGIAEGVENSNFMLQTERGIQFLTIFEKRVKESDLPFFLGLMEHLAGRGIPCPTPIRDLEGRALRRLAGKPAAIVSFVTGVSHRKIKPVHCAEVGRALAQLHLAGADFNIHRPNALSVEGWAELVDGVAARADEVVDGLADEIASEYDFLLRHWPRDLPTGIIHADLFPDNVHFIGDKLSGLIDFYFACNDAVIYDLAICLNAWCFERNGEFNITKARRMMQAYDNVRRVNDAELAMMPILARGSALRFLLTRLYDWLNQVDGALVKPKDPLEYLHKNRFHRQVSGPGAYGLGDT